MFDSKNKTKNSFDSKEKKLSFKMMQHKSDISFEMKNKKDYDDDI